MLPSRKSQTINKENLDQSLGPRRPGKPARMKKARPVLKDLQNALALRASESCRYLIVQGEPSPGISHPTHPAFKCEELHAHSRDHFGQREPWTGAIPLHVSQPRTHAVLSTVAAFPREQGCDTSSQDLTRQSSMKRCSSMIVSRSLDSLWSISSSAPIEAQNTATCLPGATPEKELWSGTKTRGIVKVRSCADRSYTVDHDAVLSLVPSRTSTPPLSPPLPSALHTSAGKSSKRSGRTYALIPAEVNGQHVFTHAVVSDDADNAGDNLPSPPDSAATIGFPEDMRNILQQLDDLACWIRKAPSRERIPAMSTVASIATAHHHERPPQIEVGLDIGSNVQGLSGKGKCRTLSIPPSPDDHNRSQVPGLSQTCQLSNPFESNEHQSEGFIYEPHNTPEFLVGSSNSLIAYPVKGYCSPPPGLSVSSRSPDPSPTHNIACSQSTQYASPATPLVSPLSGKTTFKGFFQRSKHNASAPPRSSIPLGHVPVESAFSRERRMRLPWLKI